MNLCSKTFSKWWLMVRGCLWEEAEEAGGDHEPLWSDSSLASFAASRWARARKAGEACRQPFWKVTWRCAEDSPAGVISLECCLGAGPGVAVGMGSLPNPTCFQSNPLLLLR